MGDSLVGQISSLVRACPSSTRLCLGGQVKAIALNAYAGNFNQQQALQAEFGQHMSKPVESGVSEDD